MTERRFDVPVAKPWLPPLDEFQALVADVWERRFVSNFSKYVDLLEQRAAAVLGERILAVSSCDVGMTLAWPALGVTRGEVIVPSFTLASTVNAIAWNGLTPVFADIDPGTLCLDPAAVRAAMTPDTAAIAAVHVFGWPVAREVDAVAAEAGLPLLFDAAHGLGTADGGESLARRGDASVFSMSGTKPVTAGEGGLAAFRDPEAQARFELLRAYGFGADYDAKLRGLNGKLSELNAALGYLSLGMLDEMVARREEIATRYRAAFGPHGLAVQPPATEARSHKDFVIALPDADTRARVQAALAAARIETKRYFRPVHTMGAYRHLAHGPLPRTEDAHARTLCLPIFHDLGDAEVDRIAGIVLSAL